MFEDEHCTTHFSKRMKNTDIWAYVAKTVTKNKTRTTKYYVNVYGEYKTERELCSKRSGHQKSFKIVSPDTKLKIKHKNGRYHYGKYVIIAAGYLHRLIAKAFLPNPENKPEIDHIDGNPSNNCIENLRWVSHSENRSNPIANTRLKETCSAKWKVVDISS